MSGRRQARCRDPSNGAPIVWVTQGRTQHMAFLLEDKGDYKKIRWASTSLSEWVESSAVANEMEGLGSRRRAATSASSNIAAAAAVAVKPIKRKAAAKGIEYSESKESEEEFVWDAAEEEEEEEEDAHFISTIPRKRHGSSKDSVSTKSTSNSRKSKKKKRKRKRESDDESDQEFFSDEEAAAKKRPKLKRAKTEKRPSYEEPTEEEFNEKVARKEKAAAAAPTTVDNPEMQPNNKIPRKNPREYPVSAKDIKAGATIAKKTKKRGWITGRIVSVEKLACNVHWSTGKEDKVEWERVPKLIYDADTSHYPIGTRVRKRFPNDDITKSGKVVSLNNSQYHILYKNQTKEVVGTSEMDQILKVSARKQAAAVVEPSATAVGGTMESTPRIQTPGQNTGSEAMAGKSRKQGVTASTTLAYKDMKDGPVQKRAAASLGPQKTKRDKKIDEPPGTGSIVVGGSKLNRKRSKKKTDSIPKLKDDAPVKTVEKKPASGRNAVDPPDDDVLDESRDVPVSFSPANFSSKIEFIASQLQSSSTKKLRIDLPEMEKTSKTGSMAAVDPEDSVKDDSLPLPSPKLDAAKAAETESNPGDAEIETIDLTAKKFEKTPARQKKSTLDQKDTPEILSPAMDPPADSPVARNEDESPVKVAETTQATVDISVPSAPETNTTTSVTKFAETASKEEAATSEQAECVVPETIVPEETGKGAKTSEPTKIVAGDAKEHVKLTPDDNNTASELKGKDASSDVTAEKAKLVTKDLKETSEMVASQKPLHSSSLDNTTVKPVDKSTAEQSIDECSKPAEKELETMPPTPAIEHLQKMDGAIESKPVEKESSPASKMPAGPEKINAEFAGESKTDDKNSKPVSSPPPQANTASVKPQGSDSTKGNKGAKEGMGASESTEKGTNKNKTGTSVSDQTEKGTCLSFPLPGNKASAQPKDKSDKESSACATADEKRSNANAGLSDASDVVVEPEAKATSQDVTHDTDQDSKSQLGKPKSKTDDKAESARKSKPSRLPPTSEGDTEKPQESNDSMPVDVSKSDKEIGAVEKSNAASKRSLPVQNKMSKSDKAVSKESKLKSIYDKSDAQDRNPARFSVSSEVEKKKRQREKASLQRQLAGKKKQQISMVTNAQAPPGPSAHSKKRKAVQEEQPKQKRPKSDTMTMRNSGSNVAKPRERTSRGQAPRSIYDITALLDSRKVAGQRQGSQKYFLPDLSRQAQTKRSIADVLYSRPPDRKKQVVAKPKETEKSSMTSVPPQPESGKVVANTKPQEESERRSIPTKKTTATQGFIPEGLKNNSQTQRRGQYGAQSVRPSASTGDRRSAELSTRMQAQAQTANRNASISQHHHPRASAPPHHHGGQHGAPQHHHGGHHAAPQHLHGGQHGAPSHHHGGQHGAPPHQHGGGFNDGSSRMPQPPTDYATQQRIALENLIRQQNPALYQALSHPALSNWPGNNAHHPQASNPYGSAQYAYQAPAPAPAQVRQQVAPAQVRQQIAPAQVRQQVAPVVLLQQDRPRRAGQSDPPGNALGSRR